MRPASAEARGAVVPLSPHRYKLQVTVGEEAHDDLEWLQDAMRREFPAGDPSDTVTRALKMMRAEIEKKRFAATDRPRHSKGARPGSRDIEAHVQRAVWARDEGRCAFVAPSGRRCSERTYLEYHHTDPYAFGGEATVERIALRCRAHNMYESELIFGKFERRATGPGTSPTTESLIGWTTRPESVRGPRPTSEALVRPTTSP